MGELKNGVYLGLCRRHRSPGQSRSSAIATAICSICTRISPGENPYKTPMRIYPALHYSMGGLWVDYNLMSTIPGLFVIGEANFSDHGANRLGASALMQGLADGYFVLPYTLGNYIARLRSITWTLHTRRLRLPAEGVQARIDKLMSIDGNRTVDSFHRELGQHYVGLLRHGAFGGIAEEGARADPGVARRVLAQCTCAGRRGRPEPELGDGWSCGRFHGAGGADCVSMR